TGGTVGGSFPINGNVMSTATVTDIGRLTIGTGPTAPATVDPGVTAREILRFAAVAANQNLAISYIKFTNVGTIAATDLTNIKLMDGATQLGSSAVSLAADNTVAFDLSAAPLVINSGNTKSLTVLADVVGGTNRTFRITVQRQADIVAKDNNYGINVKPYTHANDETFAVIQAAAATQVNSGTLTIAVDSSSPTGNVALSSTGITLAKFKVVASGEAVKVTTLPIQLTLTTSNSLKNVKLMLDGTQIGTTVASLPTIAAPTVFSMTLPTSGDFGSSFIIPAGTTGKILSIVADIDSASGATDALIANDTIIAQLNAGATGNAQGQTSLSSITTSAATGRLLTVASGVLTAAQNLAMNNGSSTLPNGVKGTVGARIGSFVLTAGAGEGVSVSQIQLTDSVASASITTGTAGVDLVAGTGKTITVTNTPFVVGESYYVFATATPANYLTFTVASKTSTTAIVGLVSAVGGATIVDTTAVTIKSAATGTDTLADTFQNLKLMQGATQVGNVYGSLTDTAGAIYTFTPATAISIAAGQQAVFDVYADIKTNATTLSVNADTTNGILSHTLSTATGLITNGNANTSGTVTLQNVYAAGVGSLTVAVDSASPISQQVVMGTTAVEIAKFKLSETTSAENLNITQVVVTDTITTDTHGTISNVQLLDAGSVIGTAATLTYVNSTSGTATFGGLTVTVPKGGTKVLTVRADVTAYPGATANADHYLTLASAAVTGTGTSSGTSLGTSGASAAAGTMKAVKTKLTVAKNSASPSGTGAKTAELTAAIFDFTNSTNVANQDATLSDLAVRVSTGGTWASVGTRSIKVYKDSAISANLLAQKDFADVAALVDVAFG
ncbi:MAG: hypothetical protein Q8M92_04880, partial [Candidatus Subteraquimicrobiales bacterium]|nr:hypothetical protein [Candidatus Subteraquimicrobiales bacterium]